MITIVSQHDLVQRAQDKPLSSVSSRDVANRMIFSKSSAVFCMIGNQFKELHTIGDLDETVYRSSELRSAVMAALVREL